MRSQINDPAAIRVRVHSQPLNEHDQASVVSRYLVLGRDENMDIQECRSFHQTVDRLIALSKTTGHKLSEVTLDTHGSAGTFYFPDGGNKLADPRVIAEFQRLAPYLNQNARIGLTGCEVAQGPTFAAGLQQIANVTGASVTAYEWDQPSFINGFGPSVTAHPHEMEKLPVLPLIVSKEVPAPVPLQLSKQDDWNLLFNYAHEHPLHAALDAVGLSVGALLLLRGYGMSALPLTLVAGAHSFTGYESYRDYHRLNDGKPISAITKWSVPQWSSSDWSSGEKSVENWLKAMFD